MSAHFCSVGTSGCRTQWKMLGCISKIDLTLHGRGLGSHDDALHRFTARTGRNTEERCGDHGRSGENAGFLAIVDRAHQMPLGNMRYLVRQHASDFALRLARKNESSVHADKSARKGKCVDSVIIYHEKLKVLIAVVGVPGQLSAERLDVLGDQRILHDCSSISELSHDTATDLRFLAPTEDGVGGASEIGQIWVLRRRSDAMCECQNCRDASFHVLLDRYGSLSVPFRKLLGNSESSSVGHSSFLGLARAQCTLIMGSCNARTDWIGRFWLRPSERISTIAACCLAGWI